MTQVNFNSRRMQWSRVGYTAVEMIAAIAIAMVVSVIGMSGYRIFTKEQVVESVAIRLSHVLSSARSYAIARNGFFRVTLDLDNRNFWIDEIADPTDPVATPIPGGAKLVTPEAIDHRVLVDGVQYPTGPPATTGLQFFIFGPDGSANNDARIFLYELGKDPVPDDNIYTVKLYATTGTPKVLAHRR